MDTPQIGGLAILAFWCWRRLPSLALCFALVGLGTDVPEKPPLRDGPIGDSLCGCGLLPAGLHPDVRPHGSIRLYSGISKDLLEPLINGWGSFPAVWVMPHAGLHRLCGLHRSSVASAATWSRNLEMERYDTTGGLSTGIIAAGGTLGDPDNFSTIFIILGIITRFIGELFIAGYAWLMWRFSRVDIHSKNKLP
jgi:hypothetical protein